MKAKNHSTIDFIFALIIGAKILHIGAAPSWGRILFFLVLYFVLGLFIAWLTSDKMTERIAAQIYLRKFKRQSKKAAQVVNDVKDGKEV